MNHSFLSIVNGSIPAPDRTTDPVGYAKWLQKDQEALLQIVMALKTEGKNGVNGVKSAKECWNQLADLYQGKGDQCIIFLMEKLFITSITDMDPMQPQLSALTMTAQQLVSTGLPVNNKLLAFLLVLRLPDSYLMLKTVLSSMDSTKVLSKGITLQILAEECRCIRLARGDVTAYYAKAKKGKHPERPATSSSNGKKCSHCKQLGHEKLEC